MKHCKTITGSKYFNVLFTIILSVLISVSTLTGSACGAKGNSSDEYTAGISPDPESTMVVLDGNDLFLVAGLESYPADKRADEIVANIIKTAENAGFDPDNLTVREIDGIVRILADKFIVSSILTEDAKLEGDFTPELLANTLYKDKISKAIKNYRYERQPETLQKNILKALGRTVILIVALFILFWSFKKADQFLETRFKKKIEKLESKSKRIIQAEQIWTVMKFINSLFRAAIILLILYLFLNNVMGLFPWTRELAGTLLDFVINPMHELWQSFLDYLPNIFYLIIIYLLFNYGLSVAKAFFNRVERGYFKISGFESDWAMPTYRIIRIVAIILGIIIAYPYIPGSGSDAFKGVSLMLGLLISLGSSSLTSNIIAGYTMTYRRAFKIGDRVRFGEHEGFVSSVGLLGTHIRSLKNEEIVIPNGTIINGEITNYTTMAGKAGVILHTTVGIGYEVPWRQVEAMLLMAAERTEGLRRKSEPFVLQKELGDFGIVYELNVFCQKVEDMMKIYSDLHAHIQDVFNEYEVAIMTPHYIDDTEDAKLVPKENWYASPAAKPAEE